MTDSAVCIAAILFILASSIINCLRGRGIFGGFTKYVTSPIQGAVTGLFAAWLGFDTQHAVVIGIATWIGVNIWAIPGWGAYFSAFTGENNMARKEVPWIDWIGDHLVPGTSTAENRLRGTIQMSLRGLYIYPLFIFFGLYLTPAAYFIGLLCLLQGPCYWVVGYIYYMPYAPYCVMVAELLFGAVIGAMLTLVLI